MALTDVQQTLVEENHNLIYSFLAQMRLTTEEYYGLAAIGLCKAAQAYQAGTSSFSTYAYRCMYNEIISYWRKNKKKQQLELFSLDEYAFLDACVKETHVSMPETSMIEGVQLSQALDSLPRQKQKIVVLSLSGYSCKEIAVQLGYSTGYVQKMRREALQVLRAYIGKG